MVGNPLDEFDAPVQVRPASYGPGRFAQLPQGAADANPLDEFDAPQDKLGTSTDIARQGVGGINQAIVGAITAPYRALRGAAIEETQRAEQQGYASPYRINLPAAEDMPLFKPYLNQPEPQTAPGRYARATGEAVGAVLPVTGGLVSKAEKLAALAPTTAPRAIGQNIGEFFAGSPKTAIAADIGGAAASGVGTQAAKDADLGPGYQFAAGAASPMAAIGAVNAAGATARAARGMMMIPEDAFTPTVARWKANADNIFKKLGINASADGTVPESTPGGDAAAYQMLANQLRRENATPEQLDELLSKFADARRMYSNSNAPDAMALVDMTPGMQKLAGALMRSNPEAWKRGVDFFYSRQTGLTPFRGNAAPPEVTGIPSRDMFSPPITGAQAQKLYGTSFGTPTETSPPSMVAMGQRERVGEGLTRALRIEDIGLHGFEPTADLTDDALEQMGRTLSKPLYDQARDAGKGLDLRPTLGPLLDRWEVALENETGPVRRALATQIKEFRRAIDSFQPQPQDTANRAAFGGAEDVSAGPRNMSPFERVDKAKQMLDEQIRQAYKNPSKQNTIVANALQQFKRELLDGAKNEAGDIIMPGMDSIETNALGPKYKAARGQFQSVAESRRALELGGEIWKGKAGLNEYNALSDDAASQKLVRHGLVGGYWNDTAEMPRGHDVTKLFDKPRLQEVLGDIIPRSQKGGEFDDVPERFGNYIGFEKAGMQAAGRTVGGSATAERITDDKAASALHDIVEQFKQSKSFWQFGAQAAAAKLNWLFGYRADTAARMAHALFTADPIARAEVIRNIRAQMGTDRFTYFTQVMRQMERGTPLKAASAAAQTANVQQGQSTGEQQQPPIGQHPANPMRPSTPEEADNYKSGTHFITPDGRLKKAP